MARRTSGYQDGIAHHERRISGVIGWAVVGQGWEPTTDHTPLDDLLKEEPNVDYEEGGPSGPWVGPSEGVEGGGVELHALKLAEAQAVAEWTRKRLMHWLAGEGVHPFKIVQRFYCMCFARFPELIGPLNGQWMAKILGQGRAAFSACMQRLFNIPVEAKTGKLLTVGGQKSPASREKYAESARKLKPRRGIKDEAAEEIARQAEEDRKELLRQQLMQDELKRQAEDAAFFQRLRDEAKAKANAKP